MQLLHLAAMLAQAAATPSPPSHVSAVTVPATPAAQVKANRIIHRGERITVRLPKSARFVGSERFNLYGVADAEVHVFAETDRAKRLRRLFWVQFESYLPGAMIKGYDYTDNSRHIVWGKPTWVRAGPVATGGPARAGSDREQVVGILTRAGITIPAEAMNVRLVQLLDDPKGTGKGMRELMIIYSEDLALSGRTLAELTTGGKPNAAWTPLEQPLIARAGKAVTVERN